VERRRIVEETLEAGASVARVALKYGVNANQVFQWRRLYRDGKLGASSLSAMKLLPVSVVEDQKPPKA
jgi:transposase